MCCYDGCNRSVAERPLTVPLSWCPAKCPDLCGLIGIGHPLIGHRFGNGDWEMGTLLWDGPGGGCVGDMPYYINTLKPRQNCRHFVDAIFICIFLNKNTWISINISLQFVPKGQTKSVSALAQIMAWRQQGDKPLSEQIMIYLTHSASLNSNNGCVDSRCLVYNIQKSPQG